MVWWMKYQIFVPICALQIIQLFWYWFMWRIAYRYVPLSGSWSGTECSSCHFSAIFYDGTNTTDERSDAEDAEDDEDEVDKED